LVDTSAIYFMIPLPPTSTLFPYTTLFRSKELSELAEYTGRRFFDALDGGLNEIFKGIRAHQNHPARDRHTQGHSPLAHMPRTLADITAQSASITPSAPKFPRAKETGFLGSR